MFVMFGWLLLASILLADSLVVGRRHVHRLSDKSSPSERTIIVIQFDKTDPEDVFLIGGFTNNSKAQCAHTTPPCSIPISHVPSFPTPTVYSSWQTGDNFLDWDGAEEEQGLNEGEPAKGTPTVKMEGLEALNLANSDYVWDGRLNAAFWVVELAMDCSETGGMFEVKAITDQDDQSHGRNKKMREFSDRDFHPSRFDGFASRFPATSGHANRNHNSRFRIPGLERWFNERADESIHYALRDSRKVFKTISQKPIKAHASRLAKRDPTSSTSASRIRHRKRMEQFPCSGDLHFFAPFQPDVNTFIGVCGYANIFRYGTHICEINVLTAHR